LYENISSSYFQNHKTLRAQILEPEDKHSLVYTTNLLIMVLLMIGLLFRWFAIGSAYPPWPGIGVVLLLVTNSIYLNWRRSSGRAAWFLISILSLGLLVSGINAGGFGGPIPILAPLIPIAATLLINARAGLITVIIVMMILLTLFSLHLVDKISPNLNSETGILVSRYLAVSFTVIVTTWVVWAFAQSHRGLLAEVESLANTDHLTGIANRRSVSIELAKETARVRRTGGWLSTLMVDVDHFKRFNDINGHTEGDQCLKRVAQVIKNGAKRPADLVGRYGGEEFILILPETDSAGAAKIAEAIRADVQAQNIPYENGKSEVVTVSIGSFTSSGKAADCENVLVSRADSALYQAKAAGRNRVVVLSAVQSAAD